MIIDLIGDVHGHADELEKLLTKLGYAIKDNYYSHTNRRVLFVGDYIDRGPKNRETLQIVKQMVDNGSAIALMGNHEYNALCFHLKGSNDDYLRMHSEKNRKQHIRTLEDFKDRPEELEMYLEWFKTLPLFYETETFRAVHACWDSESITYLKTRLENNRITDDLLSESELEKGELYQAIEIILKGKELKLPGGQEFEDSYGVSRCDMRYKWWEDPSKMTYKSISMHPIDDLPNSDINLTDLVNTDYYSKDEKPVFFGHYWLKMNNELDNKPSVFNDNICCLDYSVAKDGHLVSYSFDDELALDNNKFNFVKKI